MRVPRRGGPARSRFPHINDAKQFGDRIVDAAVRRVEPVAGARDAGRCEPVSLAEVGSGPDGSRRAGPSGAASGVSGKLRPNGGKSRQGWLLAVCCIAQFMVILDLSIVNVALPSIQSSLGFSTTQLQWVVDAYAIFFAGFLMLGGRAADYIGQRRTFVAALTCCSPSPHWPVAFRSTTRCWWWPAPCKGVSGALMAATSLAIITSSFAAGPARHRADRAVGSYERRRRRGGHGPRWRHNPGAQLAVGAAHKPSDWHRCGRDRVPRGHRAAKGRRQPPFRLGWGPHPDPGPTSAHLRDCERAARTAGRPRDAIVPMVAGAGLLALFGVVEQHATAPLVPMQGSHRAVAA